MMNGNGWERMLATAVMARAQGLLDPERAGAARGEARGRTWIGVARRIAQRALALWTRGSVRRPAGVACGVENGGR